MIYPVTLKVSENPAISWSSGQMPAPPPPRAKILENVSGLLGGGGGVEAWNWLIHLLQLNPFSMKCREPSHDTRTDAMA